MSEGYEDRLMLCGNSCKDILARMSLENVELKNQLSELLKSGENILPLEKAETFHNLFILTDERISFFREMIRVLETVSYPKGIQQFSEREQAMERMSMLAETVREAQKQFAVTRNDFYKSIQ